ncbi:hypothetical protein UFOVP235_44 [uncultured Caudovirales phage]|uniref:Uncharacterized protein n=1 Tax=uncultured Caudovirales phage TaxID=2100421 RepID=A0A6J7WQQ9_9CAUD|nr:hypothetical protein UFOVP235_44 [uncultured Caudovirales phage]
MSKHTTKDVNNAYKAMGRKLYEKRGTTYNLKPSKRGKSYRTLYEQSDSELSFEDWLVTQGIKI